MYLNKVSNIVVCCNNEIAFPAISQLAQSGVLKAVVVPERNKEVYQILRQFLAGSTIDLLQVNKKTLIETIKNLIETKGVSYCWLMTFSYILPKSLLDLLPGGFINFHYGILPQYRGANPILSHMLQNETHSGLTVHIMDEHIDTGPMLLQHKIPIEDRDTFGIQCKKLGMLGAAMAQQLLQLIHQGLEITPVAQEESLARYFKKPIAADLMINWETMSSRQVVRMIMACNPWNKGAGTMINDNIICLVSAEITDCEPSGIATLLPGTIVALDKKDGLQIVCCDNKIIRVNIIYTTDGFFTPDELFVMGIKLNDRFITV